MAAVRFHAAGSVESRGGDVEEVVHVDQGPSDLGEELIGQAEEERGSARPIVLGAGDAVGAARVDKGVGAYGCRDVPPVFLRHGDHPVGLAAVQLEEE
eukprot:10040251-Lingulodinium_polyedra.AAC.1